MKKILFEDALILNAVKILRGLVHCLPLGVSLWGARRIGDAVYFLTPRRKIAYKNLKAAFAGEKTRRQMRRIARDSIRNLVMSAVELLRFPDMDKRYIDEHLEFTGIEKFKAMLEEGRGIIFLTAHFGNWELLNAAGGLLGYPLVVLARAQKHPRSDEFLNSLRMSKGSRVIPKGMAVREILRSLKKGGIVGMLSDQDGGRNGVFVPFFNRLSSTPSGVATFALRTQSPIFPVFIFREKNGKHRIEVEDPFRIPDASVPFEDAEREVILQFSKVLESKIRRAPEQWLWAHRRWKSTPDRFVLVLSDGKTGHLNQSLAVLESIKRERSERGIASEHTHSTIIEVKFKNRLMENLFRAVCFLSWGHVPFRSRLAKLVLTPECYEKIIRTYADIVISCGSSVAGINLFATRENFAKSVVVMRPPFSGKRFHVVIAPEHDEMPRADNVFTTQGALSMINEETLDGEAAWLGRELDLAGSKNRIGVLIGGDAQDLKFFEEPFRGVLETLDRYSRVSGSVVLATSSRRTPAWADAVLKTVFNDKKHCPLLVIANEKNKSGVVGGILGLSDIVIVTGESISMISEAIASGKPVLVMTPWERTARLKPKLQKFLDNMEKKRLVFRVSPETLVKVIQSHVGSADEAMPLGLLKDRDVLREAVKRVA